MNLSLRREPQESGLARGLCRLAVASLAASALWMSGCSLFSDKPKPTALENFKPTASAKSHWNASGSKLEFAAQLTVQAGQVAAAMGDGTVQVRRISDGTLVWQASAGSRLSAGVGFDGERAAVVTQGNELVLMQSGKVVWRKRLGSGVSTAPLVAGERVFVLGLDRAIDAYDALDGRYLWRLQRSGDPLTLRMPGVLLAYQDTLLVGQGSRLAGVDPLRGSVRWEIPLSTPRGANEVERLADLVGPALRLGDALCARAFQSAVACVDLSSQALRWSRNIGGIHSIGGNGEVLVGGDASDRMNAWRTDTGELLWSHERLLHRGLSGVVAWGSWVAAGDYKGYVHVLDAKTGDTVMRLETDGSEILTTPRVAGDVLLVATQKGGLFAFRPN